MIITKEFEDFLKHICKEYKMMVAPVGPDGTPGLLDRWTADDYYKALKDNIEEFTEEVLKHPFFDCKGYETLEDVYEKEKSLFLYCLQNFLNDKLLGGLVSTVDLKTLKTVEMDPDTLEPVSTEVENKKEFVKEVLDGVPQKTTLKEFLTDPRSYKQFRDQVDECMLYMDWTKIHKVMRCLDWKWFKWEDSLGNEYENKVPTIYAIKRHVYDMIKRMEDWVLEHGDQDHYYSGTGGFEYEMRVCESASPDDFDNRVRFVVRFVPEQFDTGM